MFANLKDMSEEATKVNKASFNLPGFGNKTFSLETPVEVGLCWTYKIVT